jgi:tetratricopeptide (TPR) repeat protein
MLRDAHGLPISTSSSEAAAAYDRTIASYLMYRVDTRDHLMAVLKADPGFALGHCLKGYFTMLLYKQAAVPSAQSAAAEARRLAAGATPRERLHVDALEAWVGGDVHGATAIWERILDTHPNDALALRLAHYVYFWTGRPHEMLASAQRVMPKWDRAMPGYGSLLSCLCFAHEELGSYAEAEPYGREAVEIDPGDLWGTHAVAHVMEMQGRQREGIAWLSALERHWEPGNAVRHHLWWHRALYHYEQREFDAVLDLYDRHFRNLASPLTQAQPDFIIDVQNAASMLFRLERLGVDVGDRWIEIADKAETRIGDCLSAFTLPHWMMAMAATGREEAAGKMLDAMRAFGEGSASTAAAVREISLPVSQAVLAHRKGEHGRALDLMRPIIGETQRVGGSHAQHDVIKQLYLDCAVRTDSADEVRRVLALVSCYPAPLDRRAGYAEAVRRFGH